MKCKRVKPHCRTTKSGKGKSPCTKNGKGGTKVKGFYSPKKLCSAAARIQAVARGRMSRSKGSRKMKMSSPSRKHTAASKITAALRKFSKSRSAQKKKAAKIAKALKQLA